MQPHDFKNYDGEEGKNWKFITSFVPISPIISKTKRKNEKGEKDNRDEKDEKKWMLMYLNLNLPNISQLLEDTSESGKGNIFTSASKIQQDKNSNFSQPWFS